MDYTGTYLAHIDQPYGRHYAAAVGRFQEGFLRDCKGLNLDEAFDRAVITAEKLIPIFKIMADV